MFSSRFLLPSLMVVAAAGLVARGDSFDDALQEADEHVVHFSDPASVQKGINLLSEIIEEFPTDNRVVEVKLNLFNLLSTDRTPQSLAQAAELIQELLDEADLESDTGQDIALRFIDLHLSAAPGTFRDLEAAKQLTRQLIEVAADDDLPLLELRARRRYGRILVAQGEFESAVAWLFETLDQCDIWIKGGVLERLRQESYTDPDRLFFTQEMMNVAGTIGGIPEQQGSSILVDKILDELDARQGHSFQYQDFLRERMQEYPPVVSVVQPEKTSEWRRWLVWGSCLVIIAVLVGASVVARRRRHR